jgi:hypothetical protein
MPLFPRPLCPSATLSDSELKADKRAARKYYDCALGQKAVYLGWLLFDNVFYIPLNRVERVFKRLSVSKGFYEDNKVFGTLAYLVVKYDGGKEKVCHFRKEEDVDRMLRDFSENTRIPVGKG